MTEKLVSYDVAVLARDKGFNIICENAYEDDGTLYYNEDFPFNVLNDDLFAPTQSLLQKWLREVHNCIIEITFYGDNIEKLEDIMYEVEIDYYGKDFNNVGDSSDYSSIGYNTYEEALEVGLLEGLKLIP